MTPAADVEAARAVSNGITIRGPRPAAFPEVDLLSSYPDDTDRGGHFHPNKDDRYHINNSAAVRNQDGTVTFTFRQSCGKADVNCLEVPAGQFDVTARYYLPHGEIQRGEWTLPKIALHR